MPTQLSIDSIIDKNKIASDKAWLAFLVIYVKDEVTGDLLEPLRLVNNTEQVTYRGEIFAPAGFEFGFDREQGQPGSLSVSVGDPTGIIEEYLHKYAGGVGFETDLIIACPDLTDSEPELEERFVVLRTEKSGVTVAFTLGAENTLRLRFPRRMQYRDNCAWRYKGVECGYAGDLPSCDFSLYGENGCEAHQNAARFGGFPGLQKRNT